MSTTTTPESARPESVLPVRVLIVDDDRDWCETAALALETHGIQASCVYTGDEAIERMTRERFDAAIVDVHMPGRWGVDVVRELRETHGPSLPIVIATALPAAAGVCAGLLAGADAEFYKFEADEEMVSRLERLWRERAH